VVLALGHNPTRDEIRIISSKVAVHQFNVSAGDICMVLVVSALVAGAPVGTPIKTKIGPLPL
jgi:acyl-[acyl carrier protein]--UDP-N-acetylglucosamine O-acyltransferase